MYQSLILGNVDNYEVGGDVGCVSYKYQSLILGNVGKELMLNAFNSIVSIPNIR